MALSFLHYSANIKRKYNHWTSEVLTGSCSQYFQATLFFQATHFSGNSEIFFFKSLHFRDFVLHNFWQWSSHGTFLNDFHTDET